MEASHGIVARAVRDRPVAELEIGDHIEGARGWRGPVSGQDGKNDLVADSTAIKRLPDRGLDRFHPIGHYRCQQAHEAAVGVITAAQLAPQPRQCRWQVPPLEGCAVPQGPKLVRLHWQVMLEIVDRQVAAEVPRMLCDDLVAEAHDDAVGIGAELNSPPRRLGHARVAVAVEADQAGAAQSMGGLMEAVERRQHRLQG